MMGHQLAGEAGLHGRQVGKGHGWTLYNICRPLGITAVSTVQIWLDFPQEFS